MSEALQSKLILRAQSVPVEVVPQPVVLVMPKILKMQNDPCFGMKHDQLATCTTCFIRESCLVRFRNKKE